jgi:membrane dipeptidase
MLQSELEDQREDPAAWASRLGISREAIELYLASDVIDLHIDTFIWTRVLGYDLRQRHGRGLFGGRYYSQVDLPRLLEAQISGAIWSITTNPLRTSRARAETFSDNLARLRGIIESVGEAAEVVSSARDYELARAAGKHAVFIGIQGGNALDLEPAALDRLDSSVVRVTLVHLTSSTLGASSTPLSAAGGLSVRGREYIEALNARRVFVDLAHIGRRRFFEAARAHDRSQPLIVTHTGVSGVFPSWRNLDDEQLRVIADTGGVVGVVYHGGYLSGSYFSGGYASDIARHLVHIVKTVGPDVPALGSDWDGLIITPKDMRTCLELPRLVQALLDAGLAPDVIQNILGRNFLRALARLRP